MKWNWTTSYSKPTARTLTPAPHRGERNESAYVRFVCEKVAELKGLTPGEVAAATTANAKRIFGI